MTPSGSLLPRCRRCCTPRDCTRDNNRWHGVEKGCSELVGWRVVTMRDNEMRRLEEGLGVVARAVDAASVEGVDDAVSE